MQKKILALHDLSGFGRSSLVPIIAVLSAAGHQCVPMPTAFFSTHTAIPNWVSTDLTDAMQGAIEQYEGLELRFDAVYAGFLSSVQQIDLVRAAAERLGAPAGLTLIDPVMGDNGAVYRTYTKELCTRMRELCHVADLITPNTTEAAILLGRNLADKPRDEHELWEWMQALHERYGASVVMTGLDFVADEVGNACFDGADGVITRNRRVGGYYPGTGDLFAATLLAALLAGRSLAAASAFAGDFVRDCIAYTAAQASEPLHGVQFEIQLAAVNALRI